MVLRLVAVLSTTFRVQELIDRIMEKRRVPVGVGSRAWGFEVIGT